MLRDFPNQCKLLTPAIYSYRYCPSTPSPSSALFLPPPCAVRLILEALVSQAAREPRTAALDGIAIQADSGSGDAGHDRIRFAVAAGI